MKGRLVTLLWALTALAAVLLVLKSFVADVYRVDSGSMRPTLFGGRTRPDDEREDSERVLVRYERGVAPERFDLVVTRSDDDGKPLVKRAVGLPGDRNFMLRDGDVWIDGKRLPAAAPRPAPIPVHDDRWFDPEQSFERRTDGSVRREEGVWVVDGGPSAPGNLLRFHRPLRDDYLDRHHRLIPGVVEVNDAVLELEFRLDGPPAAQRVHLQLVEAGDTFTLALACTPDGRGALRLTRRNHVLQPTVGEELLAERDLVVPPERWLALSFSNVDNHLTVRLPELGFVLGVDYDANQPLAGASTVAEHFGARVAFGIQAGRARFRAVRILRDLYYTSVGSFARTPLSLGPGEYFLLGDNSSASTDSRELGPVPAERLFGRPVAVLWPEPRWLRGAVPPGN